jgi:hypothetical protein
MFIIYHLLPCLDTTVDVAREGKKERLRRREFFAWNHRGYSLFYHYSSWRLEVILRSFTPRLSLS